MRRFVPTPGVSAALYETKTTNLQLCQKCFLRRLPLLYCTLELVVLAQFFLEGIFEHGWLYFCPLFDTCRFS